ncbi:MAG: leucyl/phenylalanyl-tRNA--protein transferase [Saezia sp.]
MIPLNNIAKRFKFDCIVGLLCRTVLGDPSRLFNDKKHYKLNVGMLVLYELDSERRPCIFPPLQSAWGEGTPAPGLLAQGGDLSVERLKLAYSEGIFPWFGEGEPILWWSLDPRMVLYPNKFKLSRSLKKTLKGFLHSDGCEIRIDTAFSKVVEQCALSSRKGQDGTWITHEIMQAYMRLHQENMAHSFEAWVDGELVGGLYGVSIGGMFYGESMFSKQPNASKLALCGLIAFALYEPIALIDCQQETAHLKSLGAYAIPRSQFVTEMKQAQIKLSPLWVSGKVPDMCWSMLDV